MHQDLELLLKLQVIDYDLGELERSKEYLPDMMQNLNHEIEEAQRRHTEALAALEAARIRQASLELEVKTKETNLQKYQQQMMSIKTNKEYDALVAEIDMIKNTVSDQETELLETIDEIQTLEESIDDLAEKSKHLADNNVKQLGVLQQKVDSIGEKVSGKEDERKQTLSSIPKPIMSIYERVRRGKGGTPVVSVKKRACGSCYKALTPKKVQEIRKADRIHTCDTCGRLLYWDEQESP